MNKNAKTTIWALIFLVVCLVLSLSSCSGNIAKIISGEDGKCDYCGKEAGIGQGTKEYCGECFMKYDGYIWD